MGQTIELLENALRAWEDMRLIDEARIRTGIESGLHKPQELHGPLKHWRELRNHLLMIRGDDFDTARFCASASQTADPVTLTGKEDMFEMFPLQLASWMLGSRRVFNLSEDLLLRFIAADYKHYKWSDLLWPFDSFAINLESPVGIKDADGYVRTLPFILVSSLHTVSSGHYYAVKDGFEVGIFIVALDDKEYPTEFLPAKERERLDDDVRHKRWNKVNSRLVRVAELLKNVSVDNRFFKLPAGNEDPKTVTKDDYIPEHSTIAKIIAGLCLYLEALPAGTVDAYQWHQSVPPKASRDVRKIITDGEKVCRVEDFNVLSPDTITLFPETLRKGPAYTVKPHWRRAHYRRKKGQGNNPDAPRDVKVGPVKVHADQIPDGAVVGGAISSVR